MYVRVYMCITPIQHTYNVCLQVINIFSGYNFIIFYITLNSVYAMLFVFPYNFIIKIYSCILVCIRVRVCVCNPYIAYLQHMSHVIALYRVKTSKQYKPIPLALKSLISRLCKPCAASFPHVFTIIKNLDQSFDRPRKKNITLIYE